MRLAQLEDVSLIQAVYAESTRHANAVGHINWPTPFPISILKQYILDKELYRFGAAANIMATVRLSAAGNVAVWPDQDIRYLYIGRLASADLVRGKMYVPKVVLPAITEEARGRGKIGLRLSCHADNESLMSFYVQLGFIHLDTISIFSEFSEKHVDLIRFQKSL